jgi:chromosome partitioning protein
MKIITITSQKGGAGKTTLCRNLACSVKGKVALLDMDEQRTLTSWHEARVGDDLTLVEGITPDTVKNALKQLKKLGFDTVIIDTPPSIHDWLGGLMKLSDLVLIPVRPSPDDLRAVGDTLALAETAKANFCFVVSQAKPRTRLIPEAIRVLAQHGKVAPIVIHDRTAYQLAALDGIGVTEKNNGKATEEITELAKYVVKQLRK